MSLRLILPAVLLSSTLAQANVELPAIFSDHMVLQRDQANPVWGWDTAGTKVTVRFAGQEKSAIAAADGKWMVKLDPLAVSKEPRALEISGNGNVAIQDVLVGEVWVGSGQSNMEWQVGKTWDADLEKLIAKHPNLRLITVPKLGKQELQKSFQGAWAACTPENVGGFSAMLYFYGRQIQQTLDVPVGLVHCSWGGSACEAWVPRQEMEKAPRFQRLMDNWKKEEANPAADGKRMGGNARPGNLWAGMANPIAGYGMRGVIWYQGETNASRAEEYRELFPFMITQWRKAWGQGDFPFYWVQLADYRDEKPEPGESDWAELREAQTLTLDKLPATGEAVIIDLGEAADIHPRNKRDVAERLVRHALANIHGIALPHNSPRFQSMQITGNKAVLSFKDATEGLRTVDKKSLQGFAICGADKKWVWAEASITGKDKDSIEVSSPKVAEPVAVRYAWADNPVCNVYSGIGLPLTPFRTDDFPMLTAGK